MSWLKRLWACLVTWRINFATQEELASADVILTQAFGRLADSQPGPGNEALAATVRCLHERWPSKPIIPQVEVAETMPTFSFHAIVGYSGVEGKSTTKWNTVVVARLQAEMCWRHGWKRAIIVASPWQHGRAKLVYQKLGLEPIFSTIPTDAKHYCHPHNVHIALRTGRARVLIWEIIARLYFLARGYI